MTKLDAEFKGETRKVGNVVVRATRIIGTKLVVFSAWEPSAMMGKHRTITTFDGDSEWYGQIGSRPLPADIEVLKGGSPERSEALRQFRQAQQIEAFGAIRAAFPEAEFTSENDYGRGLFELEMIVA